MESQPQNPEFRKNPENVHPCAHIKTNDINIPTKNNNMPPSPLLRRAGGGT